MEERAACRLRARANGADRDSEPQYCLMRRARGKSMKKGESLCSAGKGGRLQHATRNSEIYSRCFRGWEAALLTDGDRLALARTGKGEESWWSSAHTAEEGSSSPPGLRGRVTLGSHSEMQNSGPHLSEPLCVRLQWDSVMFLEVFPVVVSSGPH